MIKNERRTHPRAVGSFGIRMEADSSCRVKDISLSGVCCVCRRHVSPMTVVALRLEIPTNADGGWTEIPCQGVVVRCRPLEEVGESGHEVAIFFQGLDDRHRRLISEYVDRHLSSPAD